MEKVNIRLQKKYQEIKDKEVRYEEYLVDDAEIVVTAYGLCSRLAKKAVDMGREAGIKMGLFRPITLWPFPYAPVEAVAERDDVKYFISVEMNAGQMVEDVRLGVCGKKPVHFFGRMGGIVPTPEEVFQAIKSRI
jgi:2-oxoglutarate ferredoxin oxidoreductase subunit alpha